mmetsp:Transcript_8049/g.18976  ORF Transcript_8049/g.18976 Transcript_8049/m.18976 type:complete len:336 (-) Transcript_8049:73-1080(-)
MHQPSGFSTRVVRASIESNLMAPSSGGLLGTWYGYRFPEEYVDGAEAELSRRRSGLAEGEFWTYTMNVPLLVTLPVPTGLLNSVRWHEMAPGLSRSPGGSGGGSGGLPDSSRTRDILILLSGERGRNVAAVDRLGAFDTLERAGATCTSKGCMLCAPGHSGCEARRTHMYAQAAHAVFCVEPSGDTLTRSHLYVAIQAGCVPVIFDGVHKLFADSNYSDATWWPWRAPPQGKRLARSGDEQVMRRFGGGVDYRRFAVVLGAQDLAAGTWVEELRTLVQSGRVRHLQLELDKVAHLFTYARGPCTGALRVCDAFAQFLAFVGRAHAVNERVGAALS